MARCARCGRSDPVRMHALMNGWFGPLVDLPAAPAYFHLCPDCFAEAVEPRLDEVLRSRGIRVVEDEPDDEGDEPDDAEPRLSA